MAKNQTKKEVKPKAAKPAETVDKAGKVEVEVIKPTSAPAPDHKIVTERVSGSHRVKFLPNGNCATRHGGRIVYLGHDVKLMAATTAQVLVDKGYGNVVE
jgi:hypothetical protein